MTTPTDSAATYSVFSHRDVLLAGPGLSLQEAADFMQLDEAEVLWAWEEEGQCDTDVAYLAEDGD